MAQLVSPTLNRFAALLAIISCNLITLSRGAAADEPYLLQAQGAPKAVPAAAPHPDPLADPSPWRFQVATYGWLMSIAGSSTARGQTIDTNDSFIDLVQKSDSLIGFMEYVEADKGPVGFYTDFVFTKLGFAGSQAAYRNPLPGLQLSAKASAAFTMQMFIIEMGGVYELAHWGASAETGTVLEALGGFRYWNINLAATLDASVTANVPALGLERTAGFAIARSDVTQWVDPLVGLRLRHQLASNQRIMVRGDIGGFNLANSLSWQAVAVYSYDWQFTGYQISALLGFRALGINYNSGAGLNAFGLNEVFYGPIVGASVRF
jgi:hypothetical protein